MVANPVADAERLSELRSLLRGRESMWIETTEQDPGVGQAKEALENGAELVIACGGDGTVRACAQGLIGSDVHLALIPAGTGNLLALNLEVPEDVDEALDIALHGDTRRIDTGEIAGEAFVVMAGLGLDAVIMDETGSEQKEKLGTIAYVVEGIKHLGDDAFSASIEWGDRDTPLEEDCATVLVGNFGKLQGGVDLFPDSSPSDGLLDLVIVTGGTAVEKIESGLKAAVGSSSDQLSRARADAFRIETAIPVRYELDGEARHPISKFDIRVRPHSLSVKAGNA